MGSTTRSELRLPWWQREWLLFHLLMMVQAVTQTLNFTFIVDWQWRTAAAILWTVFRRRLGVCHDLCLALPHRGRRKRSASATARPCPAVGLGADRWLRVEGDDALWAAGASGGPEGRLDRGPFRLSGGARGGAPPDPRSEPGARGSGVDVGSFPGLETGSGEAGLRQPRCRRCAGSHVSSSVSDSTAPLVRLGTAVTQVERARHALNGVNTMTPSPGPSSRGTITSSASWQAGAPFAGTR